MKTVKTLKLIISGLFLSRFGIPVPGKRCFACRKKSKEALNL